MGNIDPDSPLFCLLLKQLRPEKGKRFATFAWFTPSQKVIPRSLQ
jgi:hypothetical protein